jgi:mono/diheme cytochrome c family protein
MTYTTRFLTAALGLVAAIAPVAAQSHAKVDEGAALFTAQKCMMCHSVAGSGHRKGPLDIMIAKDKAEHIRQWLQDPEGMRARTNATRTPAMKPLKLNADQIDALVAYLTSVKSDKTAADMER